jgi:hypothetical protein
LAPFNQVVSKIEVMMKRTEAAACLISIVIGLHGIPAMGADAAVPVRVFDAGELTLDRYTVIRRLWTDTWRAAFWIPSHDEPGAAIAALTSKAAGLGADGVVNLHCINDRHGWRSGYYCYGLAVKLK